MCAHDHPVAANKAVISCKMDTVSLLQDFTGLSDGTPIIQKFKPVDFDCVTDGKVVPLAFVEELIMNKDIKDLELLREEARVKSFALDKEVGQNDVMKQIIESKLGPEYTVTGKAMTTRKGQSFNPYSRSKQDLCIQHNVKCFKKDEVVTGMISSNSFTLMEASVVDEGDLLTGVVEFKKSQFSKDQTLAEMLCTVTDCCVDQLKNAKQI